MILMMILEDEQMMSEHEYSYPLDLDWTTEEIITVTEFFVAIEDAYGQGSEESKTGVRRDTLAARYRAFKTVVPGKSEEKQLFRSFKDASGLDSYAIVKQLRDVTDDDAVIKG